ncbi:MAG: glycosyltransferase [Rhodocyclaceae bacterium]|nr:glycosyltransferase [Rhodocyclaceae bacterium]
MKPHILFVDTGKEWGGGTNSLLLLVTGLKARGYRVAAAFFHDYAGQGQSVGETFRQAGIDFHLLPVIRLKWHKVLRELLRALLFFNRRWREALLARLDHTLRAGPAARQLADLARECNVDLLYGNNQPSSNQEVLLAGRRTGLPVILHVRKTTRLQAMERDIANTHAARIICVSESVRRHYLAERLNAERCLVVPNGIDPAACRMLDRAAARTRLALPDESFVVGTICSLLPLKCVDQLLHAFARMEVGAGGTPRCVVIGDGLERERLEALSRTLGIADRCLFAGFRKDAAALLQAFDVFALPSRQEGMPRSILEAMLAARPTLAADVAGCRDLVRHGETGFLYPHGDVGALAERLRQFAADQALRQRLGETARAIVLAEYSLAAHVDRVAAVIDEVLGQTTLAASP